MGAVESIVVRCSVVAEVHYRGGIAASAIEGAGSGVG